MPFDLTGKRSINVLCDGVDMRNKRKEQVPKLTIGRCRRQSIGVLKSNRF